jgi:hypothetical protein
MSDGAAKYATDDRAKHRTGGRVTRRLLHNLLVVALRLRTTYNAVNRIYTQDIRPGGVSIVRRALWSWTRAGRTASTRRWRRRIATVLRCHAGRYDGQSKQWNQQHFVIH